MKKQTWRNFEKAREFVHTLKLKSVNEYRKFCKSGNKPKDIPTGANIAYKKEWTTWSDWLGNGVVAYKYKTWRTFEEAKHFAILLKLHSSEEWKKYCKSGNKPDDIPDIPSNIYKNKGWESWPDFLGYKRIVKYTKSNTRPFEECKKFVRSLGVTTGSEWFKWCKKNKRPDDVPYNPDEVYKEWISWPEFLGPIPTRWRSFENAREFARSLKLKNPGEWNEFSKSGKRPDDIPAGPAATYKKQRKWIGWGDFLGTGNISSKQKFESRLSFGDAKKYVQKIGFKSQKEFSNWAKTKERPISIPSNPHTTYKEEWIDWYDFLGLKKKRPFNEAREFAQSLNLKFNTDWIQLHKQGKIPKDIPRYPDDPYEKEWKGWGDFLGTGNLSPSDRKKGFKSFEESREFVRSLGIKTEPEWRRWLSTHKKPMNIPANPEKAYEDQWTTMGDWFGTGRIADKNKVWKPFDEARIIVQKLCLKNMDEYKKEWNAGKIPKDIPANPNKVYQNKGWESNGDWLGTGTISNREKSQSFLSAKEAKPVLKKLFKKYNIKNLSDWRKFSKTHNKLLEELHLPIALLRTYSKQNAERKSKK